MERHVKERLVGAAVLMAAAVILIPEMLSGPDRETREPASRSPSDAPLKTYTIDLNQPPGGEIAAANVIEERAPPPEETAPAGRPAADGSASSTQAKPESSAPPPAKPKESAATPPRPTLASTPAAPTSRNVAPESASSANSSASKSGWAVQIGSFSKQDTAERLSAELRAAGQKAFVMPVQTSNVTLYRVRVGPVKDRASAEALLRRLRARSPGAAVVTHP